MALIKCNICGIEISDKATKCPHCGKRVKKNKIVVPIVLIVILVIIGIGVFCGWNQYQKIQEEKRKEQIESLLSQVDELYLILDFDGIQTCYDALNELGYDISKQQEILEYERKVYPDAYGYYVAIKEFDEKLQKGEYSSLRLLVDTLKSPTEKFENLEINNESEIGKYISNVRSNPMYSVLNSEYVNSTEYDLDYYLTQWGYADILGMHSEMILEEKFPYIK